MQRGEWISASYAFEKSIVFPQEHILLTYLPGEVRAPSLGKEHERLRDLLGDEARLLERLDMRLSFTSNTATFLVRPILGSLQETSRRADVILLVHNYLVFWPVRRGSIDIGLKDAVA